MSEPGQVLSLALREFHAAHGAVTGLVGGWRLPLHYGDPEGEYQALRETAVAFDASHRSRLLVTGTDGGDLLETTLSGHPGELEEGRSGRALRTGPEGRIEDLLLVARTGGIAWMGIGEAGPRVQTLRALQSGSAADWDVGVEDRTLTTCLVGVTGPRAAEIVREHLSDAMVVRLQPLQALTFEFHGFRALAIRVSETGEDGFLFVVAPAVALHLLETLSGAGVQLAGHETMEVARIETCLPAVEQELAAGVTPAEAGLDTTQDEPEIAQRRLVPFILDGDAAVPVGTALSAAGQAVGDVRSSVFCRGVGTVGGLALVDREFAAPGTGLDASGKAATIVAKPIYRRRG